MSNSASLAAYRQALTTPAARIPVLASLLARMPVAMIGFSILLYVQYTTGSFATAGMAAAGNLLGISAGSVLQGRIFDRSGPTRPLLAICVLFTVAVVAVIAAVETSAATAVLVAAALATGATQPAVATASRSLWTRLVPSGPTREAAFAYEAISMEVFFILGPGVAGLLVAAPWKGSGLALGAVCMVTGSVAFALTSPVRAWRTDRAERGGGVLGALISPGMRTLVVAAAGFGVVIGFVEVGVPAVATEAGHRPLGGLLLSVWSLSSVVVGVAYSTRPWPRSMSRRLPALLAGFGITVGLLALPTSLAPESMLLLAASMVLAGALITPQATAHSSAIQIVAPRGTVTEAFGWVITAVTLGLAVGQSVSGFLVEHVGPPASFLAAAIAGLTLAAVVFTRRATVTPQEPAESADAAQEVQLSADGDLGSGPQPGVDVGVDELDDVPSTRVRS